MLVQAIVDMTSNAGYWRTRGSFMQPVFLDDDITNDTRVHTWGAYGTLCGIYLAIAGLGPLPVCPFFLTVALLALIDPSEDSDESDSDSEDESVKLLPRLTTHDIFDPVVNLPTLVALDRELAIKLQPWLELPWDAPLPGAHTHPARQFVIEVLDKNVSHFCGMQPQYINCLLLAC